MCAAEGKAGIGCLGWLLIIGVGGIAIGAVDQLFTTKKTVPDVVGMQLREARDEIERADLEADVPGSLLAVLSGDDKVCSTEPRAGAKTKEPVKLITAGRCPGDPVPKLEVVHSDSFCEQSPLDPSFVKVVVYLRNTGEGDVKDGSILPARTYQTGHRVAPLGDTLTDVNVPADGRKHVFWHRYDVGPGNIVVDCTAQINADGISRDEIALRVNPGFEEEAASASVDAPSDVYVVRSPTGNILCTVSSAAARCLVRSRDEARAVSSDGMVDSAASTDEDAYVDAAELAYGQHTQVGSMRCTSTESGMVCKHLPSGNGFAASRDGFKRL